jgi:hypothetical protein
MLVRANRVETLTQVQVQVSRNPKPMRALGEPYRGLPRCRNQSGQRSVPPYPVACSSSSRSSNTRRTA